LWESWHNKPANTHTHTQSLEISFQTIEFPSPILSRMCFIPGIDRSVPRKGILFKKLTATGRKPPNNKMNPYISTSMPMRGQPNKTIKTPPKKNNEPLIFWTPKKNLTVRSKPITRQRPLTNNIFPIASRPLSNRNNMPNSRKNIPNPERPIPIFCKSVKLIIMRRVFLCI